jgi:DNA-binding response OmpR family regulator
MSFAMTNPRTAPSSFNHPPRVLIIEDEAAISGLLEDMVSELGYEVVGTADTSSSALSELDKNNFEVALVDIVLEGSRCPEIADRLQERGVPFGLVIGSHHPVEQRHEGVPRIYKPFGFYKLATFLEELKPIGLRSPKRAVEFGTKSGI